MDSASSSPPSAPHRSGDVRRSRRPLSARRSALLPAVRVEPAERARLEAFAASAGITLTSYIRRAALGRRLPRPVPPINREAWARLGALGASLNQYVKAIHQGRAAGADLGLLEELRRELVALRRELLGEVADDPQGQ